MVVVVLLVGKAIDDDEDEYDWGTPMRPIADLFLPTPIRFPLPLNAERKDEHD